MEPRARVTAFPGAEEMVVVERVHAAGRHVRVACQVPVGLEEGCGVAALRGPVAPVVPLGRHRLGIARLQAAMQLPFVAGAIRTLQQQRCLHDAAYAADRQRVIALLQGVPGVRLASAAAQPAAVSRPAGSSGGISGGSSGSCGTQQWWHESAR